MRLLAQLKIKDDLHRGDGGGRAGVGRKSGEGSGSASLLNISVA